MNKAMCLVGSAALAIAACSGSGVSERSDAKVSSVDWNLQQSGTTTIGHVDVTYEGDHLKGATFEQNGAPNGRMDVTYQDGKVHTINVTDPQGDQGKYTWSYTGAQLTGVQWNVPQVVEVDQKLEYDASAGGRPRRSTATTTWVGSPASTSVETFDYDDSGRVSDISTVEGTSSSSDEMRYDESSRIASVSQHAGSSFTENDVTYDDSGRVSLVETTSGDRYEVSYDDSGRISQVLYLSPSAGTTLTTTYGYTDGSVTGLTFAPFLPVDGLVDLDGTSFDQFDFTSMAAPMEVGDIPAPVAQECTHSECSTGAALSASCDSCASSVCSYESACCSSSWDASCVSDAQSLCPSQCGSSGGTCDHSECTAGDALSTSCDACTSAVCNADSYCCTGSWDSSCVSEVATYCGFSC